MNQRHSFFGEDFMTRIVRISSFDKAEVAGNHINIFESC